MKRIGEHKDGCEALGEVRAHRKKTVWMTPELVEAKVRYVCADASCRATLRVIDLDCIKLPKF
jgi:hypothetical protein